MPKSRMPSNTRSHAEASVRTLAVSRRDRCHYSHYIYALPGARRSGLQMSSPLAAERVCTPKWGALMAPRKASDGE